MHSKEWPLVTFTLGMQLSAGIFVLLWGFHSQLVAVGGQQWADRFTVLMLVGILLVMVVSVLSATLHLGNPRSAYLAMSNWRSSWLSRETLLGMTFGGLVGLFVLFHWLGLGTPAIRFVLGGVTSLVGLVLVFVISQLYMLRTVPAWNTPATPIMFFASAVLLASLVMGAGLAITAIAAKLETLYRVLGLLVLIAMGTQLTTFALLTTHLGGQGNAAATSARYLGITSRPITTWRFILLTTGSILFAVYAFQILTLPILAILAAVLVLLSEVMGRFLFYESFALVGLEFMSDRPG